MKNVLLCWKKFAFQAVILSEVACAIAFSPTGLAFSTSDINPSVSKMSTYSIGQKNSGLSIIELSLVFRPTLLLISQEEELITAKDYVAMGFQRERKGKFLEAIAYYSQAIKLDPKFLTAYFSRGLVWTNLREYPKALIDFTKVIQLDPMRAPAYYQRGLAYARIGNNPQAKIDFRKAIDLYQKKGDEFLVRKTQVELRKLE